MSVLYEWNFHNRVCRVVESEPGIVHFEEALRLWADAALAELDAAEWKVTG